MSLKPPTGSNTPRSDGAPVDLADYDVEGGTVDATSTINTAAALAYSRGVPLVGSGTYKITSTVTFPDIDLDLSGAVFSVDLAYPLGSETPAVKLYQPGAQYLNRVSKRTLRLPRVQNADRGTGGSGAAARWLDVGGTTSTAKNDIGVQLVNVEGCEVWVPECRDFSIGLDTTGMDAAGTVYNTIHIGYLLNNRINHRVGQLNATGWCNSNVFIGGSYGHYDGQGGAALRVTGVRHVYIAASASAPYQVNGNVWLGSSFENQPAEWEIECYGADNTWRDCRWEKGGFQPVVRWQAGGAPSNAARNKIEGGYGVSSISQQAPVLDPNLNGVVGTVGTVASAAALKLPDGFSEVVNVTGTTNITSLAASGHTGRRVTLIFAGVLTVTDGSNLKLNGNFVTSADDSITLACDGTSWFEVSRSAN